MHRRQAYGFLLLITLFLGGNAVAGKLAVGHISPVFGALLSMLLLGKALSLCHAVAMALTLGGT